MPEIDPDGPGSFAVGAAFGPATHSIPGTPSFRSGHIQRSSGVKRKINSVGCRQSNSYRTTGPVPKGASFGENMICRTVKPMWLYVITVRSGRTSTCASLLIHVDRNGVALNVRLNGHMRKQLDWKNPGFKRPVLLTQDYPTFSSDVKGFSVSE